MKTQMQVRAKIETHPDYFPYMEMFMHLALPAAGCLRARQYYSLRRIDTGQRITLIR